MPQLKTKSRNITIFLLKRHIAKAETALDRGAKTRTVPLRTNTVDGELYVKDDAPKPPAWAGFLEPVLTRSLNLSTRSAAAVLFVRHAGRMFAVTFGYGRTMLLPSSYERDFGMKIAVNRVDPANLRSIDIKQYEDLVVSMRKQTSRNTDLSTFGLDVARDLLKALVGECEDKSLANRIAGADSVTLFGPMRAEDIPAKCGECLKAYTDKKYKKTSFHWIDRLEEVRDPTEIAALEQALLEAVKSKDASVYLAPAEIEDWDDIEKFAYSGARKDQRFEDLDFGDYLDLIGNKVADLTIEKLQQHTIKVQRSGSTDADARWRVFDCLVWETELAGRQYALYDGRWFRIDHDFYSRLKADLAAIPAPSVALPVSMRDEPEEDYNARVAAAGQTFALMDQKFVRLPNLGAPIEVCDLLSNAGHFVHVKRKTRSATLSHLFSQGTVAGELFLGSAEFRKLAKAKLKKNPACARFFTVKRPDPAKHEICYVVVSKPGPRRVLPFFSRVNLRQASERLSTLGYKVSFGFVDE